MNMFTKFKVLNRPIAPHLSIYTPQFSSLFSIWHRVSGLTLSIFLICGLILIKSILNWNFMLKLIFYSYNIILGWLISYLYLLILLLFSYHLLNGVRHIIWDLGFFLDIKYLSRFFFLLTTLLLLILIKY